MTVKIITLLTDFGLNDVYAGVMKGVILSISPYVSLVDITHMVEPQDIREAAFLVETYARYFPDGTIHLAIVDPMVGSDRKPIVLVKEHSLFVGPDNGIFSLLFTGNDTIYAIEDRNVMREEVSATFHGRDIFAPAAAHLANGTDPACLGGVVTDPVVIADLKPRMTDEVICGEVVRFDPFGNAITNIHRNTIGDRAIKGQFRITISGHEFDTLNSTYSDGGISALIGSSGYLEFAVFCGNLKNRWQLQKGNSVTIRFAR